MFLSLAYLSSRGVPQLQPFPLHAPVILGGFACKNPGISLVFGGPRLRKSGMQLEKLGFVFCLLLPTVLL
jgi:hypothetical protein